MKEIIVPIKGRNWKFILMTDRRFNRLHNSDGSDRPAITIPYSYECHFRKSDWSIIDIRHELGHVLYHMSLTASSDLTPDQVEETLCSIIGYHTPEIVLWSDQIAEKFFSND